MTAPLYYSRSVNQDLYSYALASIYQGWRVYDPDLALSRDADIFEKVRRDPVIASAIEQRLHRVAGRAWRCVPGSDEPSPADETAARLVEELLRDNCENLTEARYEAAQAVIVARTYLWPVTERRQLGPAGTRPQRWLVPTRLQDVDRRRFRYLNQWSGDGPQRRLRIRMELFSVERNRWEEVEHPEWFVRHCYQNEEARLGHGRGLLEAIYFYHWMKTKVLEKGLEWVDRWAQGVITAEIDGMIEADKTKSNDSIRQKWVDVITQLRAGNVLVYQKGDKYEVHDPPGVGADMALKFLTYLDNGITRLVNGEVRASGGDGMDSSSSRAQAETEQETAEELVRYDRQLLSETLTRDLVGLMWRQNRPQLALVGLAAAKRPRLVIEDEPAQDPALWGQIIPTVAQLMPIKQDEAYHKLGLTPPAQGDPTIGGPAQQQPTKSFTNSSLFGGGEASQDTETGKA